MLEALSLEDRVVIVTGGGTGLGRAMVRALARAGADLLIAARRSGPIEEAAQEVRSLGRRALAVSTDITDSGQVNHMVDACLRQFGQVDVLINNAGMTRNERLPIWEVSDEEWHRGIDANLSGANLERASLERAILRGALLDGARLGWADLDRSDLKLAKLNGADMKNVKLKRADLRGADLGGADLTNAVLRVTILNGTNLSGVSGLTQAQLDRACGNDATVPPEGLTIKPCG